MAESKRRRRRPQHQIIADRIAKLPLPELVRVADQLACTEPEVTRFLIESLCAGEKAANEERDPQAAPGDAPEAPAS